MCIMVRITPTAEEARMLPIIGNLGLFVTTIGLFVTTLRFNRRRADAR